MFFDGPEWMVPPSGSTNLFLPRELSPSLLNIHVAKKQFYGAHNGPWQSPTKFPFPSLISKPWMPLTLCSPFGYPPNIFQPLLYLITLCSDLCNNTCLTQYPHRLYSVSASYSPHPPPFIWYLLLVEPIKYSLMKYGVEPEEAVSKVI